MPSIYVEEITNNIKGMCIEANLWLASDVDKGVREDK